MNPSPLRLVVGSASLVIPAQPAPPAGDRRAFWRLFMNWLANADAAETEQLERVLTRHAHHVRPLIDAVSEALRDRLDAPRLPLSLIQQMQQARWSPALPSPPSRSSDLA